MLTYTYSLTRDQLLDCNKKYRVKFLKMSVVLTIVLAVISAVLFALSFVDGFNTLAASGIFLFLAFFMFVILIAGKKGVKTQNELYFKSCQVDGLVTYEFQLCETEFVVLQPAKGNVNHYLYELISKVVDLDGYAALVLSNNQYFPILINDTTAPLIATLKSLAPSGKK